MTRDPLPRLKRRLVGQPFAKVERMGEINEGYWYCAEAGVDAEYNGVERRDQATDVNQKANCRRAYAEEC